jgi:peptide/nickel transport system permease protein
MLQGAAAEYAESAPWIPVFPGLAISLAVFAFNLFGDSLRDALDPKLRTV